MYQNGQTYYFKILEHLLHCKIFKVCRAILGHYAMKG